MATKSQLYSITCLWSWLRFVRKLRQTLIHKIDSRTTSWPTTRRSTPTTARCENRSRTFRKRFRSNPWDPGRKLEYNFPEFSVRSVKKIRIKLFVRSAFATRDEMPSWLLPNRGKTPLSNVTWQRSHCEPITDSSWDDTRNIKHYTFNSFKISNNEQ
jgi:hypothetical protein